MTIPSKSDLLQRLKDEFGLDDDITSDSPLFSTGRLSSSDFIEMLLILEEIMENESPEPGSYGLLLAMGPGFCAELILLQW